jgi:hypothetical protein
MLAKILSEFIFLFSLPERDAQLDCQRLNSDTHELRQPTDRIDRTDPAPPTMI